MAGVPRIDPRAQIKKQLIMAAAPTPDMSVPVQDNPEQENYETPWVRESREQVAKGNARDQEAIAHAKALVQSILPKPEVDVGGKPRFNMQEEDERAGAVARMKANRQAIAAQRAQGKKPKHPEEFVGDVPIAYSTRWSAEKKDKAAPDYANMPKPSKEDMSGHLAKSLKSVPKGSYENDDEFYKDLYQLGRSVLSRAPETKDLSDSDKNEISMNAVQKLRSDPNFGGKLPQSDEEEVHDYIKKDLRQKHKDKIAVRKAERTVKHDLQAAADELSGKAPRQHKAKRNIDYANWEDPASGVYKGRKLAYAKALKRAKASGDYSRADALAKASGLKDTTIARMKNHIINGVLPGTRKSSGGYDPTKWTQAKRATYNEGLQKKGYTPQEAADETERAVKAGGSVGHAKLFSQLKRQGYADDDAESMAKDFETDGLKPKKPQVPKPFAKKGQYKFKKGR